MLSPVSPKPSFLSVLAMKSGKPYTNCKEAAEKMLLGVLGWDKEQLQSCAADTFETPDEARRLCFNCYWRLATSAPPNKAQIAPPLQEERSQMLSESSGGMV